MGVFLLDKTALDRIAQVREYAENNHYTYDRLVWMASSEFATSKQIVDHKILIQIFPLYSYMFVFTIEECKYDGEILKIRRVSSSNLLTGVPPHPTYVQLVIELLGFKRTIEDAVKEERVFFSKDHSIINIIELYE